MMNSVTWLQWKLVLLDLLSAARHTDDFGNNRGRILYKRVQLIATVMAVMTLFWMPLDYMALEGDQFNQVLWVRITWVVGFLLFAYGWEGQRRSVAKGYLRLLLMIVLFSISYYYLWTEVFASEQLQSSFHAGYAFIPYVAIAMLSIFPLTLLEAGIAILVLMLSVLGADLAAGPILEMPLGIKLWFIGVLSGIILWASASQLHGLMVLYREATRDSVTGLINRRLALNEVERIREQLLSHGEGGALLLADLDRFKKINDEYGHLNGDQVLRDFAEVVGNFHAAITVAGRFGGEEFLMVAEKVERDEAMEIAANLNQAVRERLVIGIDHEQLRYTTSLGVAEFIEGESQQSLLERADNALYEAKGAGRDCAILAPLPPVAEEG